jgi:hypothetical protein
MANPTPAEVNAATAPVAPVAPKTTKANDQTTSTTTTAAPDAPFSPGDGEPSGDDDEAEKPTADRFRVLKAFTLDDGMTVMPGEVFKPADVAKWPARRTKQMEDQKFLRAIK